MKKAKGATAAQKVKRMVEIATLYKKQLKRIGIANDRRVDLQRERTKIYSSLSDKDKELYNEKILRSTMLE